MLDLRFRHISTLIVKVTHRCNLDCLYCYEHITKTGEDMSIDTFKRLVDTTLESSQEREILFLFHGGEPTILPNEWYEQAIDYALQKGKNTQKQVQFSMQTNLLGLNQAKIDLFQRYKIQLGVSLDGLDTAGQTMRGGEDRVFHNYLKIRTAGIPAGLLTTINHSNYDKFEAICTFMQHQAQVRQFKANVVTPVGRGHHLQPLQPEQTFEAQRAILEYMIATKGQLLESNLMTEIQRFFAAESERKQMPATLCHEKRCGAGATVLGVTPAGDLLPCGRFQWNDSAYFLGNLTAEASQETTQDFQTKVNQFHDLVPQTWYDCGACEARKVCGFGCQAFIVRSREQANVDCLPTKMRFAYYRQNRRRLMPVLEAIQTLQKPVAPTAFQIKNKAGEVKRYAFPIQKKGRKKWILCG